jgi:16S rRNA (guanine527-N7)-methyltransferase
MTGGADLWGGERGDAGRRLNALLTAADLSSLEPQILERFEAYLALIVRWNARINLTAIRSEEGILSRHFVESIACSHVVPAGVGTLLDFGSGGGFPGIPIALCRPEIAVTLAESQTKRAAFLQEAVRTLGLTAKVYAGRAETLNTTFDCVTMRAVDRMESAVSAASHLVSPDGCLVVMTTGAAVAAVQAAAGDEFAWRPAVTLLGSEDRLIAIGFRTAG